MSLEQLERDVAELTQQVASQQLLIDGLRSHDGKTGILSCLGSMSDYPEFADVIAYGRYFQVTGQDPPDNWKPGDPIPAPSEEWCSR